MFEVWCDGYKIETFSTLRAARDYVAEYDGDGDISIKNAEEEWFW